MVYHTKYNETKNIYYSTLSFNPALPSVMHIDLNSCFASVEQQANPLLRNKPFAVSAYAKDYGCILAPSVEAKMWGIKVGMTVGEAKIICPWIIVKEADPSKYREIHSRFANLLSEYSADVTSKSIDEFVLYLTDYPAYKRGIVNVAKEIKLRIKEEIGDWLRVSIGISTNQILAKLASGLNKPNGLDIIDHNNYLDVYSSIGLKDFSGINIRNEKRLNRIGIYSPLEMYNASIQDLKTAFQSVLARYWYTRLRGWEIDDVNFNKSTFGQSYVLPCPMNENEWKPILAKLVEKGARRMRADGYYARGIHLYLRYFDHTSWHKGKKGNELLFDSRDIYKRALSLYLDHAPRKKVKKIAFSCFDLELVNNQLTAYEDLRKKKDLVKALDEINNKWGSYTATSARLIGSSDHVRDAIAFGK